MWCAVPARGQTSDKAPEQAGDTEAPAPKLEFDPRELDLGYTVPGDTAEGSFKIWNRGDSLLQIKQIRRSCGCTVVRLPPDRRRIPPGKSTTVQVSLKPKAPRKKQKDPTFSRSVTVVSNDPTNPRAVYRIFTKVMIPIKASPGHFWIEDAKPNTMRTEKITVVSTLNEEFAIRDVRFGEGPFQAKFVPGVAARSHEIELTIGPIKFTDVHTLCTIETTHPKMREVKVPLTVRLFRLATLKPKMLILGSVAPGAVVSKQIRLIPAPGHTIEWADLKVERWPMIKAVATPALGNQDVWDVSFTVPLELAGKAVTGRVSVTTSLKESVPLFFDINMRVDGRIDLAPDIPAGSDSGTGRDQAGGRT